MGRWNGNLCFFALGTCKTKCRPVQSPQSSLASLPRSQSSPGLVSQTLPSVPSVLVISLPRKEWGGADVEGEQNTECCLEASVVKCLVYLQFFHHYNSSDWKTRYGWDALKLRGWCMRALLEGTCMEKNKTPPSSAFLSQIRLWEKRIEKQIITWHGITLYHYFNLDCAALSSFFYRMQISGV